MNGTHWYTCPLWQTMDNGLCTSTDTCWPTGHSKDAPCPVNINVAKIIIISLRSSVWETSRMVPVYPGH